MFLFRPLSIETKEIGENMKLKSKIRYTTSLLVIMNCFINGAIASTENTEKAVKQEQSQQFDLKNHSVNKMNSKSLFEQNNKQARDKSNQQLNGNEWPLCIPTIGHTCPP